MQFGRATARTVDRNEHPGTECAQCGVRIDMPEWSENLESDRVRHLWRCTTCDYSFETTVLVVAA